MTDYYKHAGVDVAKGDRLVEWLKLESGSQDGGRFGHSVAGIGGFASIFRVNFAEL